jgi:two-component sensor histidine kinase/PAS domain-containing protein
MSGTFISQEQAIAEAITQPLLVLNGDLRVELANPAFCCKFRVTHADTFGRPVYELGNGQWDIPELRRLLEDMLDKGPGIEDYRVEHAFETIGQRTMLLNAARLRRQDATDAVLLTFADITENEYLKFTLEGNKEFIDNLLDSVREALLVLHWDLRVHSANSSFYEQFKVRQEEIVGRHIYELDNGQWDIPSLRGLLETVLPERTAFDDFEVTHTFASVGTRIMLLNGRRLDHQNLILLTIRDITERRRAEMRQQALMGELQHRVKNILNNVQALALQTKRRSRTLDEFFTAYEGRLAALARAQDLLVTSPTDDVALDSIVRFELAAAGATDGTNCSFSGPDVRLSPGDAQALSMTVHELSTNAVKYGALRTEGGRIEIVWRTERRSGRQYLIFDWREHGVRIDNPNPPRGFGSRVIEGSLPHILGGTATLTFHPDGVVCRLEFPLPQEGAER